MVKNSIKYGLSIFLTLLTHVITDAGNNDLTYIKGIGKIPDSIKVFIAIEKYSKQYKIKSNILYNIAYNETRYKGPFNIKYNANKRSCDGAYGTMQILPATAKTHCNTHIKISHLKDVDSNIKYACQIINHYKNKYGTLQQALGCYSFGDPKSKLYHNHITKLNKKWTKS